MGHEASSNPSPAYVAEALADAELLLKYAAEAGIKVNGEIGEAILHARSVGPGGWDQKNVGSLLAALTELAADLQPVTAESLKYDKDAVKAPIKRYRKAAIRLGFCILFFSFVSFMTTTLSNSISAKIDTANGLVAKLRAELGTSPDELPNAASRTNDLSQPPPGVDPMTVITDLQQYASTIRDINSRAEQLNWFIFHMASDYQLEQLSRMSQTNRFSTFQLQVGLTNLWQAQNDKTKLYQHVRTFAQSVLDTVSMIYGAFGSCVLPLLYALFGTCAFLLRNYGQQGRMRTYIPSASDSAHFCLAGICGAVVGLFNLNITQGASVSPLAIAFLAGYGVDVFFSFLDGLLQMFFKGKGAS